MMGGKTGKASVRVFLLFSTVAFILLLVISYYFPNTLVSVVVFKASYTLAWNKKEFLKSYSPLRRDIDAGYIPGEVNIFLCRRAEESLDQSEIEAIADFYTIQAGGREGGCIYATSDQARQKLLSTLIESLDNDENLEKRLILIEEIRRGKWLGKGRFGVNSLYPEASRPNWKEEAHEVAKAKYREWWKSDLSWEEKKGINPLKDTIALIYECCG